jgi:hypothetical protein
MGSSISLAVGNFEVDWGKNQTFNDHGALFQPGDLQLVPYHYADASRTQEKYALARPLAKLVPRLELLGHTLGVARREFESLSKSGPYSCEIGFDQLAAALKALNANAVSTDYSTDHDFGEFFSEEIFVRLGFSETEPRGRRSAGELMENLHPWNILRLVAENPGNLQCPVTWYFSDVVEGGWVEEASFRPSLLPSQRFLIVTEGSSDARILKKALELLRSEVSDFFYFVDMEEGYPFAGTGNLHRFCQGLASIEILNRVLVVYDNDAEGVAKSAETERLNLPDNMRVIRLPDLKEFDSFPTLGPSGRSIENINGRAAAIECYLDLRWEQAKQPAVRWAAYNEKLHCYQGVLVGEELYARKFLDLRRIEPGYDFSRLTHVLNIIVKTCATMAGV